MRLMTKRFVRAILLLTAALFLAAAAIYFWLLRDLPPPEEIANRVAVPGLRLVDRDGRLLYETLGGHTGRHARLPTSQIPDAVRLATIATEDRHFYSHPGVDLTGIARAAWINIRGGEVLAGGSTITQQLARNLLLDENERSERTLRRKLRESWLAWRLARTYTKDELLDFYLNQTYYGGFAYGVEAAAQTFFGRPAAELTLAQAALLAGLPQAPAVYNPLIDPEAAKARQTVVLDLMLAAEFISTEEHTLATREALPYSSTPYPIEAPHFAMMVLAEIDRLLPAEGLHAAGGVTVRTTLDLDRQRLAEEIVRGQIELLARPADGSLGHRVSSGALVALDPLRGDVLVLVGSPDFFDEPSSGAINMALAPRQPGSALKPLFYAAALDPRRPRPFTAATTLLDVRTVFATRQGESYVPVNFSRTEHGPVAVRQALGSSLNIPAVLTLDALGIEAGIATLRDFGLSLPGSPDDYDLSLALGGGAVPLLDLTGAYAALANGGERVPSRLILDVTTIEGEVLYEAPPPQGVRIMDGRVAWLIGDILSDDEARRPSFGPNSILNIGRPAAVKTGTTNDFHDNWTVGYTPDLVVGVWVGNADNTPMANVTGISGAGPIWHRFMRGALAGQPAQPFVRPEGLTRVEVCTLSGLLPSADCPLRRFEWFVAGTEPVETDRLYRRVAVDSSTGLLAAPESPSSRVEWVLALDLPPAAHGWAAANGLTLLSDLRLTVGEGENDGAAGDATQLQLRSPTPGGIYRLSAQLPREAQRLPFELVSSVPLAQVTFFLNGRPLAGPAEPPYVVHWPLAVGEYELVVQAERPSGELLQAGPLRFTVAEEERGDGAAPPGD